MITKEEIIKRREEIIAVAKQYGASHIRIVDPAALGDGHEDSDLDLIVRMEPKRSLFDLGGLLMDLRELLGIKVNLISENGIRDRWRDHLMAESVPL